MMEPFFGKNMTYFIKYTLRGYLRNPVHYKQKRGQEKDTRYLAFHSSGK